MDRANVLIVPGLGGSAPEHWQSIWQARNPGYRRVEQRDWDDPDLAEWAASLEDAVRGATAPVVLVAHSLACPLVAHWARRSAGPAGGPAAKVAAAMLVSPVDIESEAHTPPEARRFAPMPLDPLPFRTAVVASGNDPHVAPERARHFASCWRARLVEVGDQGHVNVDSGHGEWPEGERILAELLEEVRASTTGTR